MKILALDSSGLVASVALLQDETLVAEYTMNYKKTHSQTLLPMLDEIKRVVDLDLETLDAIAVAAGPGSFTGLRIGSATAKGWLFTNPLLRCLHWRLWPIIFMILLKTLLFVPSWMPGENRYIQEFMHSKTTV